GLMYKDVKLCLEEAEALGVQMWVGAAVRQIWQFANAELGTARDFTAIVAMHRGMGRRRGQGARVMQTYEVYAIRYGRHDRLAGANFIGGDPHDGSMPLDYYVWAIVGGARTYVVDTGFNPESARKRGRQALRTPAGGLRAIGIDPGDVGDVIVTHMHYD